MLKSSGSGLLAYVIFGIPLIIYFRIGIPWVFLVGIVCGIAGASLFLLISKN